jgi:hypothetical protein
VGDFTWADGREPNRERYFKCCGCGVTELVRRGALAAFKNKNRWALRPLDHLSARRIA